MCHVTRFPKKSNFPGSDETKTLHVCVGERNRIRRKFADIFLAQSSSEVMSEPCIPISQLKVPHFPPIDRSLPRRTFSTQLFGSTVQTARQIFTECCPGKEASHDRKKYPPLPRHPFHSQKEAAVKNVRVDQFKACADSFMSLVGSLAELHRTKPRYIHRATTYCATAYNCLNDLESPVGVRPLLARCAKQIMRRRLGSETGHCSERKNLQYWKHLAMKALPAYHSGFVENRSRFPKIFHLYLYFTTASKFSRWLGVSCLSNSLDLVGEGVNRCLEAPFWALEFN